MSPNYAPLFNKFTRLITIKCLLYQQYCMKKNHKIAKKRKEKKKSMLEALMTFSMSVLQLFRPTEFGQILALKKLTKKVKEIYNTPPPTTLFSHIFLTDPMLIANA